MSSEATPREAEKLGSATLSILRSGRDAVIRVEQVDPRVIVDYLRPHYNRILQMVLERLLKFREYKEGNDLICITDYNPDCTDSFREEGIQGHIRGLRNKYGYQILVLVQTEPDPGMFSFTMPFYNGPFKGYYFSISIEEGEAHVRRFCSEYKRSKGQTGKRFWVQKET